MSAFSIQATVIDSIIVIIIIIIIIIIINLHK